VSLPIVLLHGFPFDGGMWEGVTPVLQSRGKKVLTPDLPGFGHSSIPAPRAQDASIEAYAEEVHQLLRHQGGRAIVGGFSMGGYVLLALLRAHPDAVAWALFISTRAEADSEEARAVRLKSVQDVRTSGTAALVESMLGRLLPAEASPAIRDKTRSYMRRQSAQAVIAAQSAMARRRDQTDLLPKIHTPSLIIVGSLDIITPPASAQKLQQGIPRARLVELPQVGHMSPVEAPEKVGEAIADFASTIV